MTTNPLDEIQARADAATEGPWAASDCAPCTERGRLEVNIYDHTGNFQIATWCDDDEFHRPDAEFIAHAREDVPKLVAALRAVEAVHAIKYYDKWGRTSSTYSPDGQGGWCDSCGRIDGEKCKTITAIREALG